MIDLNVWIFVLIRRHFVNTAVIDIGSNTVKFTVFSESAEAVFSEARPLGLIGLTEAGTSSISKRGVELLTETIEKFVQSALCHGCSRGSVYLFATAALRAASNSSAVKDAVRKKTGYDIDIISGEKEAELSYNGMLFANNFIADTGFLTDLGGGSCEVMRFDRVNNRVKAISLPCGALSLYKKFENETDCKIPDKRVLSLMSGFFAGFALSAAEELAYDFTSDSAFYALGGTVRAIRSVCLFLMKKQEIPFAGSVINDPCAPFTIGLSGLSELGVYLMQDRQRALRILQDIAPDRVTTFVPGIVIYTELLKKSGHKNLTVVEGGAREGYYMMLRKNAGK